MGIWNYLRRFLCAANANAEDRTDRRPYAYAPTADTRPRSRAIQPQPYARSQPCNRAIVPPQPIVIQQQPYASRETCYRPIVPPQPRVIQPQPYSRRETCYRPIVPPQPRVIQPQPYASRETCYRPIVPPQPRVIQQQPYVRRETCYRPIVPPQPRVIQQQQKRHQHNQDSFVKRAMGTAWSNTVQSLTPPSTRRNEVVKYKKLYLENTSTIEDSGEYVTIENPSEMVKREELHSQNENSQAPITSFNPEKMLDKKKKSSKKKKTVNLEPENVAVTATTSQPANYYLNAGLSNQSTAAKPKYIIGIDVGNTYSGYAFGITNEIDDKINITINKNWASSMGYTSFKAPTALFSYGENEQSEQQYFGFHAFKAYASVLDQEIEVPNDSFYQTLHPTLQRDESADERFKFMGKVANFLIKHCLSQLNLTTDSYHVKEDTTIFLSFGEDVFSMSTKIKKAMKKQACDGVKVDKNSSIQMVSNTQVDFFYCIHPQKQLQLPQTDTLLVISAGGSEITCSLYEKLKQSWSTEQSRTSKGGLDINIVFQKKLMHVLGEEFVNKMLKEYPAAWYAFMSSFEKTKCAIGPQTDIYHTLPLDYIFSEVFRDIHNQKLSAYLKNEHGESGLKITKDGTLSIHPGLMKSFFSEFLDGLGTSLKCISKHERKPEVIVVTGGMANSAFIKHKLKEYFPNSKIIIPENYEMCTAVGSVLYGLKHTYLDVAVATCDMAIYEKICKVDFAKDEQNAEMVHYRFPVEIKAEKKRLKENGLGIIHYKGDEIDFGFKKPLDNDLYLDKYEDDVNYNIAIYTCADINQRYVLQETIPFSSKLLKTTQEVCSKNILYKVQCKVKDIKKKKTTDKCLQLTFHDKNGKAFDNIDPIHCNFPPDCYTDAIQFIT